MEPFFNDSEDKLIVDQVQRINDVQIIQVNDFQRENQSMFDQLLLVNQKNQQHPKINICPHQLQNQRQDKSEQNIDINLHPQIEYSKVYQKRVEKGEQTKIQNDISTINQQQIPLQEKVKGNKKNKKQLDSDEDHYNRKKEDSQWQSQIQQKQKFFNQDVQRQRKKTKTKRITGCTKNLLINFRTPFINFIKQNQPQLCQTKFYKQFQENLSVNRQDYQKLFKMPQLQQLFSNMFQNTYLAKQIQNTRVDRKLIPIYLKKIKVLEKAFKLKWFPRIN